MQVMRGAQPTPADINATLLGWLSCPHFGAVAAETTRWGPEQVTAARQSTWAQGVGPLLCRRLRGTEAFGRLPPQLQAYIREEYHHNSQRVAVMNRELGAILARAERQGLEVMLLKGMVLASHYYNDPALRPMADVDVLVRPEHEGPLRTILEALGHRLVLDLPRHRVYLPPGAPADRHARPVLAREGEHPGNPRSLELHTRLRRSFRGLQFDVTNALWSGCRSARFNGKPALVPKPSSLLLHLLVHTSARVMRGTARFIDLYDIALVGGCLTGEEWSALVDDAVASAPLRMLYVPLALAARCLGDIAPDDIMARLRAQTPPRLVAVAEDRPVADSLVRPWVRRVGRVPLDWYWPGREWLTPLRCLMVPTPDEVRERSPWAKRTWELPAAYAQYWLDAVLAPLRRRRC